MSMTIVLNNDKEIKIVNGNFYEVARHKDTYYLHPTSNDVKIEDIKEVK